jgi:hypothetical protein
LRRGGEGDYWIFLSIQQRKGVEKLRCMGYVVMLIFGELLYGRILVLILGGLYEKHELHLHVNSI